MILSMVHCVQGFFLFFLTYLLPNVGVVTVDTIIRLVSTDLDVMQDPLITLWQDTRGDGSTVYLQ